MIPYGRHVIDKKDIREVERALSSDFITQGPRIVEFEKALARYTGARYAVAVSSGTAALHLAYLAAGLKTGDEVITTPNTFVATANMLLAVGAKPVFCDIRLDNGNIDETRIKRYITPRTQAIVPVHFAGHSCEMDKIRKIARRRKLVVIEDACHALGARYKEQKVGNCRYSDMAVFSFHPVKSITTGEGGAILTNHKKLYERMISLRSHGIHKDKTGKNVMTDLGYNYRMTDIQAALGLSQLSKIDTFVRARNRVAKQYDEFLKSPMSVLRPIVLPENYSARHIYVVRVREEKQRDKLASFLKKHGIGVNFHYPAVYSHPYYREHGYQDFSLENEEKHHNSCLTLPCYPGLTTLQVRKVSGLIRKFFRES